MISILSEARAVLDKEGFATYQPSPTTDFFYFEDTNVLGVLYALPTVKNLLLEWEELQDQFLKQKAPSLVMDPFKAWNCYCALLTSEKPGSCDASKLFSIEENFRGTRKLVRAGVSNRQEVLDALAPLLSLRRRVMLESEDAKARLTDRLKDVSPSLEALLNSTTIEHVAARLLESE